MTNEEILKKVEELLKAKDAVSWCLKCKDNTAGMHGLSYWAGEVERLREELHSNL